MPGIEDMSDDTLVRELRRRGHVPVLIAVGDAVALLEADDGLRGDRLVATAKALLDRSADAIAEAADMAARECLVGELARSRTGIRVDADVELPEPGTRVILKSKVDRYPNGLWSVGETGTVDSSTQGMIALKLDTHYPDLAEWDNCIEFYAEMDGKTARQMVEEFWGCVEPLPAPAPGM